VAPESDHPFSDRPWRAELSRPLTLYRRTFRTYLERIRPLLLIGAVVFVPLGLLEAAVGQIGTVDTAYDSGLIIAATVGIVLVQVAFGLLGEVFYSGAVSILIARFPSGTRVPLRRIAGELNYGRLIGADILYVAAVGAGLLLFVVPGVLMFTLFALVAPLIELERLGLRAAFARSRQLVRGRFWTVLAVLGPLTLLSDSLDDAILGLGHTALGDSLAAEWLADSVANIALSPLYAVPAVLITIELMRLGPMAGRPQRG
jgi:hypothetical protein